MKCAYNIGHNVDLLKERMGHVCKCTRDMYGPLLDDLRCMYVCTNDIENEYKYEIAGFGHKKGNYNNVIFSKSHI